MFLEKELCKLPETKTMSYRVESLLFMEGFLWNSIKQETSLTRVKNKIKIGQLNITYVEVDIMLCND